MDRSEREKLLALGKSQEDKIFLAKVLDKIAVCAKTFQTQVTDFLDPMQQQLAESALTVIPDAEYLFTGGYPQAERRRLVIYPDYLTLDELDDQIACLRLEGNFRFQKVNHRDYLGAILGLGLKRTKLGDILVQETGAQVLADREMAEYLTLHLTKIHRVSIQTQLIPRTALELPAGKVKELKTTVASLRLDAVAAAGFGSSRTQITKEILAEKVKLSWQTANNPAQPVQTGDILSIRGRGRVEVVQVGGSTKKGRISLTLHRYL